MRSSNPILKPEVFSQAGAYAGSEVMTVKGTIDKTFVLLCLLVVGAGLVWGQPLKFSPWAMPAAIIGFILALITTFKRDWAPVTAPLYAFAEGIVVGLAFVAHGTAISRYRGPGSAFNFWYTLFSLSPLSCRYY